MNSNPSDFESLRKLLALKRYEQPPPGYFNRLPDQIMARLERGDERPAFWERFLAQFVFRPALAYGVALVAFSALTLSVMFSVKTQSPEIAQAPGSGWRQTDSAAEALASRSNPSEPLHVVNWMGYENYSNPAPAMSSLFDTGARRSAIPVSFAAP